MNALGASAAQRPRTPRTGGEDIQEDFPPTIGKVTHVAESGQEPEDTPDGPVVRDPSGNRLRLA